MLASRALIRSALGTNTWKAYRLDKRLMAEDLVIGPHSIDVTLGNIFMCQSSGLVDAVSRAVRREARICIDPYMPLADQNVSYDRMQADSIELRPGQFLLAFAQERFDTEEPVEVVTGRTNHGDEVTSNFVFTQIYDGRSTMGRLGIMSHVTAGYGDYGFKGNFTLELANVGEASVILHAGMRIGQVSFHGILGGLLGIPHKYNGAYPNQRNEPVAPVLGRDRF